MTFRRISWRSAIRLLGALAVTYASVLLASGPGSEASAVPSQQHAAPRLGSTVP